MSCWFSPAAPLQGFKDDDRDDDDHLPAPFGFRSSAPLGGCGRADDRDDNDRLPAPFGFRSSAPLGGCGCGLPVGGRCAEKELSRACWNEPQLCQYCPFLGLPLRFRPWTSLGVVVMMTSMSEVQALGACYVRKLRLPTTHVLIKLASFARVYLEKFAHFMPWSPAACY